MKIKLGDVLNLNRTLKRIIDNNELEILITNSSKILSLNKFKQ